MPWRLIGFVLLLALIVAFVGLNLGNSSAISFGFATLENVPIFLSLAIAFILGALAAVPITIASLRRRKQRELRKPSGRRLLRKPSNEHELPPTVEERGRRAQRRQKQQEETVQPPQDS